MKIKLIHIPLIIVFLILEATQLMANETEKQVVDAEKPAFATFAGGCFWCLQSTFDHTPGVISTSVGFSGGDELNPTYNQVAYGKTGHLESIQVKYYPSKVSYKLLLHNFFLEHDPYDGEGQFCDRGAHYRPAAFYHNPEQKIEITDYISKLESSEKVKTQVLAYKNFFPAEEYHQDFYKKEPEHYQRYKAGCGRDRRLKEIWKDKKSQKKD